jgi:hypothetical protein
VHHALRRLRRPQFHASEVAHQFCQRRQHVHGGRVTGATKRLTPNPIRVTLNPLKTSP